METSPSTLGILLLMGMTAYLGIHHLGFWFARAREPLHLWIAAWCGTSLFLQLGRLLQYTAQEPETAVFGMRVALGSSFILVWLLVGVCCGLTRVRLRPGVRWAFLALNLALVALTAGTQLVVTDSASPWTDALGQRYLYVEMGPLLSAVGPYAFAVYLYGARLILRSPHLGAPQRLALLASFGVYLALGLNDLLVAQDWIDSIIMFEWSPVVLALVFDGIVMHRFRQLTFRLEDEVELRTDQLRSALHEAEASERAKSEFLANMSHEIRTPMNAVLGALSLVRNANLRDEQRQLVATAHGSASELLRLLDDLLVFSKLEADKVVIEQEPFDAAAVVHGVAELYRPACAAKEIELQVDLDGAFPPLVVGDSLRVRQVLTNLLSNALKFTEEGSIKVSASTLDQRSDSVLLGFEVSDTGVGVDPADASRLFDPFSQTDASTTRRYGGTGLGLAISRRLVAQMGGEMRLESKLGQGSVFSFTVRFRPVIPAEASSAEPSPGPTRAEELPEGTQILLAEDNLVNQTIGSAMLEKLGCVVHVARDGAEATHLVESRPFDLVLMDCQMPKIDGLEATHHIRERETERGDRRLPIVALTAHAMPGDRERCLAAGMDDYLTKPIEIDELRSTLRYWLARRRG